MTFGYRLNVEQLMYKRASYNYEKALSKMVDVPDSIPETGKLYYFEGPGLEDDETIALCIECIIEWAASLESFVNLVWLGNKISSQEEERNYSSTIAKIKRLYQIEDLLYGDSKWKSGVEKLFAMRNYLMHYKEAITYTGFSFATKFQHEFSKNNMIKIKRDIYLAIKEIGGYFNIDCGFVDGDYDHLIYKY